MGFGVWRRWNTLTGFWTRSIFGGRTEGKNIGIHDREILSFASIITDICCYSACAL
jgi:hypothetical protein